MKKITSYISLSVFLWASVISPAKAVMPLIGAAAVWFFNQTAATQIAIGSSVAIHATIAAITFSSDTSQPNDTGVNKTLTVQLDPYVPLVNPASSVPTSVSPTTQEVVISDLEMKWAAQANYGGCSAGNFAFATSAAAKTAFKACYEAATPGVTIQILDCLGGVNATLTCDIYRSDGQNNPGTGIATPTAGCVAGSTWNGADCVATQTTCPSGYTLSGQTCNPTASTQLSDNKKSVLRSGNTFVADPNDPDVLPSNVTVSSNKVTVKNSNGRTDEVVIEPNGTLSTYHWEPNPQGDTLQTKVSASAPSAGSPVEVTAVENKVFSGSSSSIGGSSGTSTAAGQTQVVGDVNFDKTGLATDAKQCGFDSAHPCVVQVDTNGLGANIVSSTSLDDAAEAHLLNLENVGQGGEHGWSWDWNPLSTIATGSCTDPSFIINGKSYVDLNGFCTKVDWFRGFLEFMLYISTGIVLFNIMTGRREEV